MDILIEIEEDELLKRLEIDPRGCDSCAFKIEPFKEGQDYSKLVILLKHCTE